MPKLDNVCIATRDVRGSLRQAMPYGDRDSSTSTMTGSMVEL